MLETQRFGKYLLYERIAVGGMAEVFRAKPAGSDKLLALKRIHPHHLENNDFVSMLIDEAKISVQLAHPNIIQVVDLGRVDHHYFIAMEYIAGRDLRRVIERVAEHGRPFPIEHAVAIIGAVARGLDYAHQKEDARGKRMEIIHRDISPQNVLVGFDGTVKVIDFGIAKAAGRLMETQVGILKGKYAYMSPEQATGGTLDHRTDIFSTGIMLYECCVGKHPFRAPHDLETLRNIKNSSMIPPREANPAIPPSVERVILQSLASKKEDRYFTAGAMAEELEIALEEIAPGYSDADLAGFLAEIFGEEAGDPPRAPAPERSISIGRRADLLGAGGREATGTNGVRGGGAGGAGATAVGPVPSAGATPGSSARQRPRVQGRPGGVTASGRAAAGSGGSFLDRAKTGQLTTGDSILLGLFSVVVTGLAVAILLMDSGSKVDPGSATPTPAATELPPVKPTEMVVESSPAGADVRVRGQLLKGKTPIAIQGVPEGQRLEVTVSKAGHAPESKLAGGGERVSFALREVPTGFVTVTSNPPGAEIRVGGAFLGRTPLRAEVPSGDALVEARAGGKAWSKTVQVPQGQDVPVDLSP